MSSNSQHRGFAYNPDNFWGFETAPDRARRLVIRISLRSENQRTPTEDIISWNDATGAGRSWSEAEKDLSGRDYKDHAVVVGELIPKAAKLQDSYPTDYVIDANPFSRVRRRLKMVTRDKREPVCIIVRLIESATNTFYILTRKIDGLCGIRAAPNQLYSRCYIAYYDEWAGDCDEISPSPIRAKIRSSLDNFCTQYRASFAVRRVGKLKRQVPIAISRDPPLSKIQLLPLPRSGAPSVKRIKTENPSQCHREWAPQTPRDIPVRPRVKRLTAAAPNHESTVKRFTATVTTHENTSDSTNASCKTQDLDYTSTLDTSLQLLFSTNAAFTDRNAEELLKAMEPYCNFVDLEKSALLEWICDFSMFCRRFELYNSEAGKSKKVQRSQLVEFRDTCQAALQFARLFTLDTESLSNEKPDLHADRKEIEDPTRETALQLTQGTIKQTVDFANAALASLDAALQNNGSTEEKQSHFDSVLEKVKKEFPPSSGAFNGKIRQEVLGLVQNGQTQSSQHIREAKEVVTAIKVLLQTLLKSLEANIKSQEGPNPDSGSELGRVHVGRDDQDTDMDDVIYVGGREANQ